MFTFMGAKVRIFSFLPKKIMEKMHGRRKNSRLPGIRGSWVSQGFGFVRGLHLNSL